MSVRIGKNCALGLEHGFSVIGDVYLALFALKSPTTLLGIKRICFFAKELVLTAEFLKKTLTD